MDPMSSRGRRSCRGAPTWAPWWRVTGLGKGDHMGSPLRRHRNGAKHPMSSGEFGIPGGLIREQGVSDIETRDLKLWHFASSRCAGPPRHFGMPAEVTVVAIAGGFSCDGYT